MELKTVECCMTCAWFENHGYGDEISGTCENPKTDFKNVKPNNICDLKDIGVIW